jgi:hypothetical protein
MIIKCHSFEKFKDFFEISCTAGSEAFHACNGFIWILENETGPMVVKKFVMLREDEPCPYKKLRFISVTQYRFLFEVL